MASSSRPGKSGSTRKFVWLAVAVALAILLYSGGWFYAAGRLTDMLERRMEASRGQPFSFSCANLEARGFPFRIGIFCGPLGFDDRGSGTAANFGALRSAAQVYRPGHAIVELDGPAQLRISPDIALIADWSLMHASGVGWTDGLDRASLAYDEMKGRFSVPAIGTSLGFAVRHGEAHLRRADDALDVAASFDALALDFAGLALPAFDAMIDMTITDGAQWISPGGPPVDAPLGMRAELRRLSLDLGGGHVAALSGPLSVDEDGYISGTFDLDVQGISVWRDRISQAFPDIAENMARIAQVIQGLGGGGERATVKLTVKEGSVYLGVFPIAFIPPV